uniref:Ninein-like n=1 Tax=Sparus aurata TaxID=8175 RepID=A0A671Y6G4_SPAAU
MEEAEQSRYVAQLRAEFDSCDTTATGFLDRDELTALCRKLQLDAHLPLLLDTLLGERPYARVNFEEFKEGFVAVLSRSLDFSTSEDDSSYLEPGETHTHTHTHTVLLTSQSVRAGWVLVSVCQSGLGSERAGFWSQSVRAGWVLVSVCQSGLCSGLWSQSVRAGWVLVSVCLKSCCCCRGFLSLRLKSVSVVRSRQTLDFPLEERLSLADLTLALDNELLVSGNGIHQAALISYKNEIQHLQVLAEQACRERDKVKADLELADQRNLQLVREVDDRHASMETLNQSRIRDLEHDFRDRLTALRSQSEQESEALLQLVERERSTLQDELQLLRAQEAELQEELCNENSRLEDELTAVKLQLTEAEGSVNKLQRDLDQLLHDKFGSLDPAAAGLSREERFSEIVKDFELQCRELRDRNDELSSELELLKNQKSDRKSRRSAAGDRALSWTEQRSVSAESDSDESDMKRSSSPLVRKKLQPADKTALGSLDCGSGPAVSIQTELALEQLEQKHNQELQQLHIQLDTQMNYYERSLELMRQSMEVERKDISQAFKMEISELEEQKTQVEQQVKQLKEALDKLQTQIQRGGGGGGWSSEQERRMQRERAELEQNFAREISNLVHKLSAEKDQLEAELKLKMDQEVMVVRTQLEEVRSENGALQERLSVLQQEVQNLEDHVAKKRRKLEEMEREHDRSREEEERLHKENSRYREEVLDLSSRNLQLSNDNAELSARLRGDQESVRMLQERLATVSKEQEEEGASVSNTLQQEREKMQQQAAWTQETQLLERELSCCKEKKQQGPHSQPAKVKAQSNELRQFPHCDVCLHQVEKLQQSLLSLESETELLRSQLHAVNQEKLGHAQEVSDLQRKLQVAQNKVEELESSVRKLAREKEELHQALEEQEEQISITLQEETHRLRVQNQELQHKLTELQVQGLEVHKLTQEQQNLKNKLTELEVARTQAQDQAVQADTTLSLVQAQHVRQLQEVQERAGDGCREQVELLQARLMEEQRRSQQLEETLRLQAQQSCSQITTKQDQYEKAMLALQERMEELETKLKGVRLVLQEKVQQLKEQLSKNTKSSVLLKDLYVENSQLMKALQVTEQRQKKAEKKNSLLEQKVGALNKLLREIVHASLAT